MINSVNHIHTHSFVNNAKLVRENEQLKHFLATCNEFKAIEKLIKENDKLKKLVEKLKKIT